MGKGVSVELQSAADLSVVLLTPLNIPGTDWASLILRQIRQNAKGINKWMILLGLCGMAWFLSVAAVGVATMCGVFLVYGSHNQNLGQ
jgi:hypothetical protein